MRSWTSLASSGTRLAISLPFLANESRRSSNSLTVLSMLAPALAQFALDAHARFAHLALEAVARGHAAALEAAQLRLRLGAGGVVEIVSLTLETTRSRAISAAPTGIRTARSA